MTEKPDNPRILSITRIGDTSIRVEEGMTLRDYFAAAVLPALAKEALDSHMTWVRATAVHAYAIADALLTERSKP